MLSSRYAKLRWMIPIVLIMASIVDAALPAIFPKSFLGNQQIIVSHIVIYYIVMFAYYFRDSSIVFYSAIFGLFYDGYNTTMLGINAVLFYLIALIITKVKKYLPFSPIIHLMLFIVMIAFLDTTVYVLYLQLGLTTMNLLTFITSRLASTLIFNLVVAVLLYIPSRSLMRWLGWEDYVIF